MHPCLYKFIIANAFFRPLLLRIRKELSRTVMSKHELEFI